MIGMMRSGSNLLERQLGMLRDVRCHGELFNPAFMRSKNLPVPEWLEKRSKIELPFVKV